MITAYICTPIYFYIQKGSPPLLVDYYVVDLIDCTTIGGFSGQFVNDLVGEDCTFYYTVIVQTKINQPFSIVINIPTAMLPHSSFAVAVVRRLYITGTCVLREGKPLQKTTGPPGWGLGVGPTTPPRKNYHVTETATANKCGYNKYC